MDYQIIINDNKIKLISLGYCACGCGRKTNICSQSETKRGLQKGRPRKFISGHNTNKGGWTWDEENRARLSQSMRGNTYCKGRTLSDETKRRIGDANKKANPVTFYDYICETCGKEFKARQKDRRFCGIDCRNAGLIHKLICESCGQLFSGKVVNVKFCNDCKEKVCQICGKKFMSTDMNKKYCSHKCYHDSTIGKEPWNKDYIDMECQFCGKEFQVTRKRQNTAKYCCRDCKHNAQSEVTGPAHPLWKGGFDLYGRLLSQNEGSFYRNRVKVLERDNNTCCHCGHQGESKYMDVHHIIPVREKGPSTEENMLTLCRKCHNWADRGRISRDLLFSYIRPRRVAYL